MKIFRKKNTIVSEVEKGKQEHICDFVNADDPRELDKYYFEDFIKSSFGDEEIALNAAKKSYQHLKNNDINLSSVTVVGWMGCVLESVSITEHRDKLEKKMPHEFRSMPSKEELRSLFARALACLGYKRGHFNKKEV